MWTLFPSFLVNLAVHWIGGVGVFLTMLPFLESKIEHLTKWLIKRQGSHEAVGRKIKSVTKDLRYVGVVFLAFACFQAWTDEHHNTEEAINGKDGKVEAWRKYNQCDKERFGRTLLADQLGNQVSAQQSQLGGQQDTFNRCMLALGVKNAPEPLKINTSVGLLQGMEAKENGHRALIAIVIAETNKTIIPTRALIECDTPFESYSASLANEDWVLASGNQQLSDKKSLLKIDSPAWRPGVPLIIALKVMDTRPQNCRVTQQ
jgi:hypothetical protein